MELNNIIHTDQGDILNFAPDFFIAASGYESRALCLPKKLEHLDCVKYAFGFDERLKNLFRKENDAYFKSNGYELIIQKTHGTPDFHKIFGRTDKQRVHVLIDISVMTRDWYHGLLKYLHGALDFEHFHLRITYCPALYSEPSRLKRNITLRKFSFSDDIHSRPKELKKTALILGLGLEKGISEKIHDMIKPDLTFLMYSDPTIEKKYVENLFVNNHNLINRTPIRFLKGYPLEDTRTIYQTLIDTLLPLRQEYKIVIIPQGPKIFSLMAMIFQISYPDIDLYYPSYKLKKIRDRKPYLTFTSIDLEFDSDL